MYLGNFINKLNKKYKRIYFSELAFNSSKVKKDNIFFAIRGTKSDGNNYINDAIKKGAKIVISDKNIKHKYKNIICIQVNNPRKLLAETSYKLLKKKTKKNYCGYWN